MSAISAVKPPIALGPLDGRYRTQVEPLVEYLSEAALNKYRLLVEVEWLIFLTDKQVLPGTFPLTREEQNYLRNLVDNFGAKDITALSAIEAETKHDVKAVEYYLKAHIKAANNLPAGCGHGGVNTQLPQLSEMVHIFCTSEDINNLAYALCVAQAVQKVWLPAVYKVHSQLVELAEQNADTPMLSRTHGQTATPTTLGKEMAVFAHRLGRVAKRVAAQEYLGKINGATGTYGAHLAGLPNANWIELSKEFVSKLGITWNPLTTQIEQHDWQAEIYSEMARAGRILHNLATDMWTYISLGYFKQNLSAQGSTGSSTMPHKVNPIRFENAEANFEISGAIFDVLGQTIVTSRLQRDLTDSSTQRNVSVAFGHSLLALDNLTKGLSGVEVDKTVLLADLDEAWEVLAEPVQQAMRVAAIAGVKGMADPYERLKELTRGRKVTGKDMQDFLLSLGLPSELEIRLLEITPAKYIGLAPELVKYLERLN